MTRCPACGGPCAPWRSAPGGEPADDAEYALARCTACGSARTLAAAAPGAHASGVYAPRPPRLARLVRFVQRVLGRQPLALLRRAGLPRGARVLDAGAGIGRLVEALREAGYEASGIDPEPRGGDVARATIEEHEDAALGAVVLWHVLEHVEDPVAALRRVASWLDPGGVVVVGVPNVGSLQAQIAGAGWFHLDLPRHRTHFTERGLEAALEQAGLHVEQVSHLVPEHNLHGMWFALLSRLGMTPGFPFHLVKRNVRVRPRDVALLVAAGPPLLPVAVVLELLAAAARRGGTIAAVARRT